MKALLPWMEVDAVDVALYMPTDAFIDSALLCSSYAKAAARLGVTLRPNCKVKEIMVEGEHIDVSEVPNMGTEVKGVVEALYTAPRWMVQAEYYFDRLNRTDGRKAYRPHGGYIQGGFLLKGRGFEYDAMYGIPSRPATPQAIELVARLNYTDMNDNRAGIYGGEETDLSLGVNWYINQYLGVKLNGSYVWVGKHCNAFYKKDFFLAQLRLQYIF